MRLSEATKAAIVELADAGCTLNKIATTLDIKWESVQRVIRRSLSKDKATELVNNALGKLLHGQKVPTTCTLPFPSTKTRATKNRQARKVAGAK